MHLLLRHEGWTGRGIGLGLGGLAVCGQAPLHLWPITLICLTCLYVRLHYAAKSERPRKAGFHSAMWFALGYFGVSLFWVGSAFIARGPAFIPIMPPMVLGLAALLAIFWGLAGGLYAVWLAKVNQASVDKGGVWAVLAFTSFFFLAEFARGHLFGGLPWNLLGYIFAAGSAPSQIAAWINIYGITWLVVLMGACLGQAVQAGVIARGAVSRKAVLIPSFTTAAVLIGLFGYGHLRLSNAQTDIVEDVKIRIVSVPFEQADHFDPQKSFDIVNAFLEQSLAPGVEDVTHIVWPEGAALGLAMDNYGLLSAMGRGLAQYDDTPPVWIMQSLRLESLPDAKTGAAVNNYYNSSVAVTFDGAGNPAIASYNDKYRLVPFGEFIPGGKWFEKHIPVISAGLSSMSPATRKELSNFPNLPRVSPQICYEALFAGLTPKDLERPAELIVNQSNDAWYGKSWGPLQHANMARYRTIEQGIPMIRVASNGVSGVFDPYGRADKFLTSSDLSHLDAHLPKSLKLNNNAKLILLVMCLLNLAIGLSCAKPIWVDPKGVATE